MGSTYRLHIVDTEHLIHASLDSLSQRTLVYQTRLQSNLSVHAVSNLESRPKSRIVYETARHRRKNNAIS